MALWTLASCAALSRLREKRDRLRVRVHMYLLFWVISI